jgi:hypothetical protein
VQNEANFFNPNGDYTIDTWFYIVSRDVNKNNLLFKMFDNLSNPADLLTVQCNLTNGLIVNVVRNNVSVPFLTNRPIVLDTWYHLVIERDSSQGVLRIYLNGQIVGVTQEHQPFNNTGIDSETGIPYYTNLFVQISTFGGTAKAPPKYHLYNFEIMQGLKYNGVAFTPSNRLPVNKEPYFVILTVSATNPYVIVGGEQLFLNYDITTFGTNNHTITNVTTSQIIPGAVPAIYSTICLVAGMPVLTDNDGYVPVEQLEPGYHTINGSNLLVVTKTLTPEKHLAVLPIDSLAPGVPSAVTLMSLNHKIFHNGDWTKSINLTTFYVEYNSEVLYNVVLDKHGPMTVNNMTVETLDKDSIVAQLFLKIAEMPEHRSNIIEEYNSHMLPVSQHAI